MPNLEVHVLASGSDGNCSAVVFENRAIIIDAGMSYKKTKKLIDISGLDESMVEGILITHEHSDHVGGAGVLARKLDVPIICNKATFRESHIDRVDYQEIRNMDTFEIAGMEVTSLPTSHHAVDPCAYYFKAEDKNVMYVTDTGKITYPVEEGLRECDLAVVESNYDKKMLIEGDYPLRLKKQIDSDEGHMCNVDTGEILKKTMTDRKRKIFLAHLSQNNNTPDIARDTVAKISGLKRATIDCPEFHGDVRVLKV